MMSWSSYRNRTGKKNKNKSIFGGSVKSKEEIAALNKAIEKTEAEEFEAFHADFQEQADEIWGEPTKAHTEKKEKPQKTRALTAKEKLKILSQLQINLKTIMNQKNKSLSIS